MVTFRTTAARQTYTAHMGAADGSRAPRAPQRPTAGDTLGPTRRQQDAKRRARGGRVPAVVRNRMTPRGRSVVPVDEEDDLDEERSPATRRRER